MNRITPIRSKEINQTQLLTKKVKGKKRTHKKGQKKKEKKTDKKIKKFANQRRDTKRNQIK